MKKTNKTFKRFAAITSASLLAACAVAPVFTSMTSYAASITIEGISSQKHQFKVYQIFTGEITQQTVGSGESETTVDILSKLKWGSGVSAYKTDAAATAKGVNVGDDVPETFSESLTSMDARAVVELLTFKETETIYESTDTSLTIPELADGYYYIEDVSDFSNADESNSAWIVQVAKDATIAIKNAKPTVDKLVWDNDGGENGTWDETADWNINDKYMSTDETPVQQSGFKLIATVPQDEDLAYYDSYKLVFNDSMSTGVTYDGIRSVTISDATGIIATINDYNVVGVSEGEAGKSWTLTIEDLKSKLPDSVTLGSKELKVEVIYNAHLNDFAITHNESNGENGQVYKDGTTVNVNNNSVYLEYSNNPDATGGGTGADNTGKTTEDTVGVFTYKVVNTKRAESESGKVLPGAKFKLYSDAACKNEIKLKASNVSEGVNVYIPDADGTVEMVSGADGTFNIIGLDAGTYYVKETEAPAGYNLIKEAKAITITATHSESGGTNAVLDLGENAISYTYVNNAGTTLPGTGGIGTTIFYLGGGAMAAIGGIYLVSKRRMRKSEE